MHRLKNLATLMLTVLFLLYSCVYAEGLDRDVNLYPIRENGKWGFMDKTGNIIIIPSYDAVSACINGYIAVSSNDNWGIIDYRGEIIVSIRYRLEWKENCSVIILKDSNDSVALFYTKTGTLSDFKWKNAIIEQGKSEYPVQSFEGLWGYVNDKGEEFIPCILVNADLFNEGWAGVDIYNLENRWFTCDALINQSGEMLFPPEGYSIINWDGVSEGLIQIQDNKNGLIGYMNMQGKIVIQPTWLDAHAFHGMFAAVQDSSTNENYYLDVSGKILDTTIHPPVEGDDISTAFSYGVTTVFVESSNGTELAIMDDTGSILFINHNNDIAWIFHYFDTERAWYVNNHGLYGLINKSGQLITYADYECLNENGSPLIEGVMPVAQKGLWGYIDSDGVWIITPKWERAWPFCNGLALVQQNKMLKYIDREGNVIWSEK